MAVYRLQHDMPMPFYWDSCSAQQSFSFRTGFSPILKVPIFGARINFALSLFLKLTRPKRCDTIKRKILQVAQAL